MDKKLLKQTSWNLDELLPPYKSSAHNAFLKKIDKNVSDLISNKKILTDFITITEFRKLISQLDQLSFMLGKLGAHANLLYSKNVKDEKAKAYLSFVDEFSTEISNKLLFIELWYIKLPKQKAMELADSLGVDAHVFRKKYAHGRHVLTESEEKIINLKDNTGSDALAKLYNTVVSGWSFDFDGKKQSLSQMKNYLHNSDRQKRKGADALITAKYREYEDILGDIYVALTKDYGTEQIKLRKYPTPLSVRTSREEISQKAVHALFDAARSKQKLFHDFFKLRAKLVGLKKLETYDLLAPIGKNTDEKIPYEKAMTKVFETIEYISPEFLDMVQKLVEKNHIDSLFHPNKMGGAYNYGLSHGIMPYVFMQYLGARYDMYTIVHELGHSVHSMHMSHLSSYSAHSGVGIAESVSTFFEEMLFERELSKASDEKKIELLAWKLSDLFASVSNGAYVSYFETLAHDIVNKGGTHQDLSRVWTKLKKEQLGPHVNSADNLIGWMSIPHIFEMPFYYYNYAVGNLIALLFLQQFRKDPQQFRENFKKYLHVGGTMGVVETLKLMNVDVEDKKTWERCFSILESRVNLLRNLMRSA